MNFKTKQLLKRAQAGDSDAFVKLFQSNAELLWKQACKVLRNEQDASDALQETAIKAWQAIPNFDGRSRLQTWLTRILLNCCYDILRIRKAEFVIDIESALDSGDDKSSNCVKPNSLTSSEPYILDDNESHLVRIFINETLDKLSDNDKQIITLFYFADMTTRQISETLEISEQSVRVRLTRARERFRKHYLME